MASIDWVRNIGISAHIDSGKTTLTERILYYTGKIHRMEEVRGKSGVGAKMDFMELEREKGITIQSAATYCQWGDAAINIIDTPGHVDFTIEVERALRVLDGAILVLCGVAGVQSQSMTVDRQMKRYRVPRLAFINKLDRTGANPLRVVEQLRDKLGHNAVPLQLPIGLERDHAGIVDLIGMRSITFGGEGGEDVVVGDVPADMLEAAHEARTRLIEAAADFDDRLAEKYLEGEEILEEELVAAIRKGTLALKLTPVLMGSAYRNKGVQALLDAVVNFLPSPREVVNEALDQARGEAEVILESTPDKPFVGLAFKIEDGRYGQLTYMRVYQGRVKKGDQIVNTSAGGRKIKVPRIVRMHADEMHDIPEAAAGDIVALFGVECSSGDTFTDGTIEYTMTSMHVPEAVISMAVWPKEKAGEANFSKALGRFSREDPTFRVHLDPESNQTIIRGMGELHLGIYVERIKREYGCAVETGRPQVAFRESITRRGEFDYVHKKQTGGRGQYARVCGYVEPLPPDAVEPFEFVNDTTGGSIPKEFIPACEKGFREAITEGSLIGFPVVGVRAVVNDGQSHAVDSSEMAFKTAAIMAFREAYAPSQPVILEPTMKVEVQAPTEFQGAVSGQVNQRRGMILSSENADGLLTVQAEVPLSEMFGYSTDLRSATQGKGEFTMEFLRYVPVPKSLQEKMMADYQKRDREGERAAR